MSEIVCRWTVRLTAVLLFLALTGCDQGGFYSWGGVREDSASSTTRCAPAKKNPGDGRISSESEQYYRILIDRVTVPVKDRALLRKLLAYEKTVDKEKAVPVVTGFDAGDIRAVFTDAAGCETLREEIRLEGVLGVQRITFNLPEKSPTVAFVGVTPDRKAGLYIRVSVERKASEKKREDLFAMSMDIFIGESEEAPPRAASAGTMIFTRNDVAILGAGTPEKSILRTRGTDGVFDNVLVITVLPVR